MKIKEIVSALTKHPVDSDAWYEALRESLVNDFNTMVKGMKDRNITSAHAVLRELYTLHSKWQQVTKILRDDHQVTVSADSMTEILMDCYLFKDEGEPPVSADVRATLKQVLLAPLPPQVPTKRFQPARRMW